jgi:hypothetical protein
VISDEQYAPRRWTERTARAVGLEVLVRVVKEMEADGEDATDLELLALRRDQVLYCLRAILDAPPEKEPRPWE